MMTLLRSAENTKWHWVRVRRSCHPSATSSIHCNLCLIVNITLLEHFISSWQTVLLL